MAYSEQEKIEEFQRLREFFDSVEIASEVLPKGKFADDVCFLVSLPSVEDMDDENIDPEDLHIAAGYFLDMDDTENSLAKYLIFYTQIAADISCMSVPEILLLLNESNRTVRVGHYFYGKVEGKDEYMVQYRATVTGVEDQPFDEGIVADTIVEMGVGYDVMKGALEEANEECRNKKR